MNDYGNVSYAGNGGAISIVGSTAMMTSCLFEENQANYNGIDNLCGNGGAMLIDNSDVELIECTFRDNTASRGGQYIALITGSGYSLTLTNCIGINPVTDVGAAW